MVLYSFWCILYLGITNWAQICPHFHEMQMETQNINVWTFIQNKLDYRNYWVDVIHGKANIGKTKGKL